MEELQNNNNQKKVRKDLEYSLDQFTFDYLIIGTGLTESLYSSHLQKISQKKCLVIDQDDQYSSSIRTLNFKEYHQFLQELKTQNQKQENSEDQEQLVDFGKFNKEFQFSPVSLNQEQIQKNTEYIKILDDPKNYAYRRFNIDLQPKLLFSTSLTVDMMRQADMDKYMEFKAVQGIYHFDNSKNKFILAPSTKGDIFKHKSLSLKEKKDMFNILHKCVKLYYLQTNYELDQNSIDEFDKDFEIDEKTKKNFEQYKDSVCTVFLESVGCSQKVMEIFMYTICNFEFNVIDWKNSKFTEIIQKECTTIKFLAQVAKFIRSCGVHTKLPYLYTSYGTGDIPQGFSRIGAVFGGQFVINKNISIYDITFNEQNEMIIDTNLIKSSQQDKKPDQQNSEQQDKKEEEICTQSENEDSKFLKITKGSIIGQEFRDSVVNNIFRKNKISGPAFEKKTEEGEDKKKVNISLLRINFICERKKKEKPQKIKKQKKEEIIKKEENNNNNGDDDQQNEEKVEEKQQPESEESESEEEEQQVHEFAPPILYNIPPKNKDFNNQHPILLFQLDSDTSSAPKEHQIFQVKTVVEQSETFGEQQMADLVENLAKFIEKITIFSNLGYNILYSGAYIQKRTVNTAFDSQQVFDIIQEKQQIIEDNSNNQQDKQIDEIQQQEVEQKEQSTFKILFTQQENFEIDMDRNFEEFRSHLIHVSEKFDEKEMNYFMTIKELNGENEFEEDSEEDEDGLTKLINQFDDLKQPKQKQEEQIQEQEQKNQDNVNINNEEEQEKQQQQQQNIEQVKQEIQVNNENSKEKQG